ncbi:hypothetical protein VTO73DRAFT_13154 [Trametes versicolor]
MPATARMTASGSDPAVKALVNARLPSRSALNAALRACPRGANHMYQPSFGHNDFAKTGIVYDVCLYKPVKDGPPRCPVAICALQMSKEKRIELLRTISELEMPPYNNERYATDALLASMRLRRGEDEWPPTPTTPARRQTPRTSHSNTRSGTSAASSRIGRPRNPTTTVTVYIYAEDGFPPLEIAANAIDRGARVEFTFGQPLLNDLLGIDKTSRNKKTFLLWLWDAEQWSEYPKAHSAMFLPPGEALLYKAEEVYDMPGLREYQERVLPVAFAARRVPSDLGDFDGAGTPSVSAATRRRQCQLFFFVTGDYRRSFSPQRWTSSRSPDYRPARFSPSPVSSPDLPDAREMVRRHWGASLVPTKVESVAGPSIKAESVAGPSHTSATLSKRRARSPSAGPSHKRARSTYDVDAKREWQEHTLGDEADVIDLSDDDESYTISGRFPAVVSHEVVDKKPLRIEVLDGKEFIIVD